MEPTLYLADHVCACRNHAGGSGERGNDLELLSQGAHISVPLARSIPCLAHASQETQSWQAKGEASSKEEAGLWRVRSSSPSVVQGTL